MGVCIFTKLKNVNEWQQYCKLGQNPDDIPSNPNRVYSPNWNGKMDGWALI